ncbi:hypothetical protein ACQ4PT_031678 [Festuca glaucescens]
MDLSVEQPKLSDADGGGEDRLSALPDDVLIHILVLLDDAAEAARTSILTRRWHRRRLWALLPELNFIFIEHHRIGAALAAHEAPGLSLVFALTEDASPESASAWLPMAARDLYGKIYLEVVRPEAEERGGDIHLPCFDKASCIMLKPGFLRLSLPPSGVFARLKDLWLVDFQVAHGQCGLGDLLSSQRCPSLQSLVVRDARGLDSFHIRHDSLLDMELSDLHRLQQLTVVAPALQRLKVCGCFTNPPNRDMSAANISAPQLTKLEWTNDYDPSSIQLDIKRMTLLERLNIQLFIQGGLEGDSQHNHYCMMLLRHFGRIHTLDLLITYPPEICTGPYLMEHMPRLPNITLLALCVTAYGHSFGGSTFDVLRRCTSAKKLDLYFLPERQLGEQTPCPSGCFCDEPPSWRTEELALNCLEEIEIHHVRGTEHEVALVQRLFHWATALKRMKIVFHELITESKANELCQLLPSFSRPDICMDISMFVP